MGDILQETDYTSFVKQGATIFNLLPECVKNAPNKSAAKRAIAKETNNITMKVNKNRMTRGLPPIRTSW
jgi:phosphopantetheine adenylyltransferase